MTLTDADYDALALPELRALLIAFDALDAEDVEAELAGDILTLEFPDGTRYVLNSHRAARQIWMAAGHAAWHFSWFPEQRSWRATKTGEELWSQIATVVSVKLGRSIQLRPH